MPARLSERERQRRADAIRAISRARYFARATAEQRKTWDRQRLRWWERNRPPGY